MDDGGKLTEEKQEVRNSEKEKKHLGGKSKEKVSEPTMHWLKGTYLENKKQPL